MPPACQLYMLWPPDVSTDQVNKFGQVYSDCHQMSLAGELGLEPVGCMSDWGGGLYSEVKCIMDIGHMGNPHEQTDRHK